MTAERETWGLRLFEPRRATHALWVLAALYATAFALCYPAAITVSDEGSYIRQAQLISLGTNAIPITDPFTGEPRELRPRNNYPLGTAMLLAPFVSIGSWQTAAWLPLLCTLAALGITGRWLYEMRYSPLWAALLLAYPATLVMARVAMSEAPSLLLCALGMWLYWRGRGRGGAVWLGAGFVAGLSFAFRESNVLLFAPLFLGSLLRRDRGVPLLVVGGLIGLAVRGGSAWWFFGDPLFAKAPNPFSPAALLENAPTHLLSLLVLVPGGLVAGLAYRGPRRVEVVATIVSFTLFYLLYDYSAEASSWTKRLILGPRFFIPLLPLLALCAAEVWPRLATKRARASTPGRRRALERAAGASVAAAILAIASASVAVQWVHAGWTHGQARIRDAIYANTPDGSILVTNWRATGKFIDVVYGDRIPVPRETLTDAGIARLAMRHDAYFIVFLDRSDSAFWRLHAADNAMFVASIRPAPELVLDLEATPTDRLRIYRVRGAERDGR